MKLKSILASSAAVCALALPTAAHADNWYLSVFGGYSSPDNDVTAGPFTTAVFSGTNYVKYSNTGVSGTLIQGNPYNVAPKGANLRSLGIAGAYFGTSSAAVSGSLDDGFVIGAALGMDFQDGWRAEIEGAYRQFDLGGRETLTAIQNYKYSRVGVVYFSGKVALYTTVSTSFISSKTFTYSAKLGITTSTNFTSTTGVSAPMQTDGEVSSFSLMANLWYEFDLGDDVPLTPFIGVGGGVAYVDAEYRGTAVMPSRYFYYGYISSTVVSNTISFAYAADEYVFAWQFGAGLGYDLGNGMMLSAQYRYFATGNADLGGRDVSIQSHEALIGLTFPLSGM